MRTVIYDAEDMEPITVIDVPQHFIREMEDGTRDRRLRFVAVPSMAIPWTSQDYTKPFQESVVEIDFEPIYKGRERLMWLATTRNGETALLLRSVFLPGQQSAVNQREREAFLRGMFAAMGA